MREAFPKFARRPRRQTNPTPERHWRSAAGWRLGEAKAHALCLAGDVASTGGAKDASGYYREALALAGELGMRPLAAHCDLGLGKLYRRTGKPEQAQEHLTAAATMYREMDMPYWLEQAEVGVCVG